MRWISNFYIVAVATLLLLSACNKKESPGVSSSTEGTIKIGEFASLTGKEAAFGTSSHNGTTLAIEDLNASGGILGRKLELLTEDDQSKKGEASTAVKKLISRDKVVAMLGEVASSLSLEAAPICQTNKIPMISPSSTNPKVTEVGDYIFRICFIDPFQGTVMARFSQKTLKAHKVATLTDVKQSYSEGLSQFFKEQFLKDGGQIVAEQKFSSGDKDFNAQLTAINAAKPEAIFVPSYYTEAALIVQQARQLGIQVPLFGGDGWEAPELLTIGGKAMEGCYYSTHYSPESQDPAVQNFVKKYKAKFKAIPDAMAALGYDSAMILADAIKRAGSTDGDKIRAALVDTKGFEGVTGKTELDKNRNATKPAVIITIKDGAFKYVETIAP